MHGHRFCYTPIQGFVVVVQTERAKKGLFSRSEMGAGGMNDINPGLEHSGCTQGERLGPTLHYSRASNSPQNPSNWTINISNRCVYFNSSKNMIVIGRSFVTGHKFHPGSTFWNYFVLWIFPGHWLSSLTSKYMVWNFYPWLAIDFSFLWLKYTRWI